MRNKTATGSDFLLKEAFGRHSFCPEDFSTEQRQIGETAEEFVRKEILPDIDRLESQDFELVCSKMRHSAELGLLLADIPEEFGGLELDKATCLLLSEKMAPSGSFAITFSGQTGIGSLPLIYYGTPRQKDRYLSKLTSAEWIGAYGLTEPECGSDPLSARTTATLSADGRHYILNGVKQFITSAGFAGIFTIFAKIDGQHFSAFLVERTCEGLSIGPEEKKMGLKGSSTAQVLLDNLHVPVENLLGEAGKGHKIAFNVLNIGRLKIAANAVGLAKSALTLAAGYARQRKQFRRPIAEFGAIREKLADMAALTYACESMVYRIAGLLDERIADLERGAPDYWERYRGVIEEFAAECALAKVFCTESLSQVVDEALQIHGGYGYISEYAIERYYRDERINRIFEGTNEINRMLIPTLLLRRAQSGALDLQGEKDAASLPTEAGAGFQLLANLKNLFLSLLETASSTDQGQEVQLTLADMCIAIFALESTLLRTARIAPEAGGQRRRRLEALALTNCFEQACRFQNAATRCAAYLLKGEKLRRMKKQIYQLCDQETEGLLQARQLLAEACGESDNRIFWTQY